MFGERIAALEAAYEAIEDRVGMAVAA